MVSQGSLKRQGQVRFSPVLGGNWGGLFCTNVCGRTGVLGCAGEHTAAGAGRDHRAFS